MGRGISVGPYAFIEGGAVIGDGSVIESHAVVKMGSESVKRQVVY